MKKLVLCLLLAGLVGGIVGYRMWNKPHMDMAASASDIAVDAAALFSAYNADEAGADAQYLDKIVDISGKVTSYASEGGLVKITLDPGTPDALGAVICDLDQLTTHERTAFKEGEEIKLKCHCAGYTGIDVQLVRCVEN